jgi:FAD/FMN-containing dehydrogenase
MVVVLPNNTAQVAEIMCYCHRESIKIVPRGAGTSLSGGALPLEDGVLVGLGKFKRVLEIDIPNRCAVVQPGSPIWPSAEPCRARAFITHRTPRARLPAPLVAMSPKIPAACIA